AIGLDAREHVEAGLEPGGPPVGDLEGFVKGALGAHDAVLGPSGAARGDVAVQFHHRAAGSERLRSIDLDLEVVLRAGPPGRERRAGESGGHEERARVLRRADGDAIEQNSRHGDLILVYTRLAGKDRTT